MKWKVIDDKNIADIMLEVFANNEIELFGNILEAFADIITKINKLEQKEDISIKITGDDLENLIQNFIDKLIYYKDVDSILFKKGKFRLMFTESGYSLYSILSGQKITPDLPIKTDIKALTLHKFKVEKKGKKYKVSLVFDI